MLEYFTNAPQGGHDPEESQGTTAYDRLVLKEYGELAVVPLDQFGFKAELALEHRAGAMQVAYAYYTYEDNRAAGDSVGRASARTAIEMGGEALVGLVGAGVGELFLPEASPWSGIAGGVIGASRDVHLGLDPTAFVLRNTVEARVLCSTRGCKDRWPATPLQDSCGVLPAWLYAAP